jgi:hypothetical protein
VLDGGGPIAGGGENAGGIEVGTGEIGLEFNGLEELCEGFGVFAGLIEEEASEVVGFSGFGVGMDGSVDLREGVLGPAESGEGDGVVGADLGVGGFDFDGVGEVEGGFGK